MMEPKRTEQEFDAYSRNYDDVVNDSISFSGLKVDYFTQVKVDYMRDEIAHAFPDSRSADLLDVGCGVGNYHPYLAGYVRSISGVDVSGECIETAKSRNSGVSYQAYDGTRLPFADNSFDIVYTVCVMHHVPPAQWALFAREMRRVMRPKGLVMVFEHNPLNPLTRHIVSSCEFDKDAVLLRSGKTESLLRDAGFAGIETKFILSVPAKGKMMRSIDGIFARLPFGAQYYTSGRAG